MDPRLTTALLFSLAIATGSADAATRCQADNLSLAEETACAKAAQGTEALRRYVQRTRSMHGLYVWDYAKRDAAAAAPQSAGTRATQPGERSADAPDAARAKH